LDLSGWTVRINPREEWKQMLREAWRRQRDFFYDAKMHGVDWEGVWKQYGPLRTAFLRATISRTCSAKCSAS